MLSESDKFDITGSEMIETSPMSSVHFGICAVGRLETLEKTVPGHNVQLVTILSPVDPLATRKTGPWVKSLGLSGPSRTIGLVRPVPTNWSNQANTAVMLSNYFPYGPIDEWCLRTQVRPEDGEEFKPKHPILLWVVPH